MTVYLDIIFLVNFLVDFLLLLGAGHLCGYPVKIKRAFAAAALGGIYGCSCLLPGFYFLGNILWRTVSLTFMAMITYGFSASAIRNGLIFAFLSLALGGAAIGIGKGGVPGLVCAAGILFLICCFGFRAPIGSVRYIPVELSYGEKRVHITALKDTGNTLRDPITGRQVLVVGADVANALTGLTREQLCKPVDSLGVLPGLRLIPYRSVGTNKGFLLALRLQDVKIGRWKGSSLVAFAPDGLSAEGAYQALTGGVV